MTSRKYIKEGPIEIRINGKSKEAYLIAFNNLFLLCKSSKKGIAVESEIEIDPTICVDFGEKSFKIVNGKLYVEFLPHSEQDMKEWEESVSKTIGLKCSLRVRRSYTIE